MLSTEQLTWDIQIHLSQIDKLITLFAVESVKLGTVGKGFAIIADEMNICKNRLYTCIKSYKFGEQKNNIDFLLNSLNDTLDEVSTLTVNLYLESLRVTECISAPIWAEEMRQIIISLSEYSDELIECVPPEISFYNNTTSKTSQFMAFSIGNHTFIENVEFIQEVLHFKGCLKHNFIQDESLILRGMKLSLLDTYKKLSLPKPNDIDKMKILVIRHPDIISGEPFAIIIDNISSCSIFSTRLGAYCDERIENISHHYIRTCWKSDNEVPAIFLDWNSFL